MFTKRVLCLSFLFVALVFPAATAQDAPVPDQQQEVEETKPKGVLARRAEKRRQRIMEEYRKTDNVEACVPMRSLRQSIILDNRTIFFEANGRRGYMNRLPNTCPGLLREQRFAYANSFGSICRAQIITILDSFGRTWGSCGLGDFEEWEKKPKDESGDK